MAKQLTRFAGKLYKADLLIGKKQTIIDKEEKPSKRTDSKEPYFDVQAIVDGIGLVRYSTSAKLLVKEFREGTLPMRDKVIQKDWRGLYFEGTVYTLEEEEKILREKFNVS